MYVLRESILHKLNNVRSWHTADDQLSLSSSMSEQQTLISTEFTAVG